MYFRFYKNDKKCKNTRPGFLLLLCICLYEMKYYILPLSLVKFPCKSISFI